MLPDQFEQINWSPLCCHHYIGSMTCLVRRSVNCSSTVIGPEIQVGLPWLFERIAKSSQYQDSSVQAVLAMPKSTFALHFHLPLSAQVNLTLLLYIFWDTISTWDPPEPKNPYLGAIVFGCGTHLWLHLVHSLEAYKFVLCLILIYSAQTSSLSVLFPTWVLFLKYICLENVGSNTCHAFLQRKKKVHSCVWSTLETFAAALSLAACYY